MENGTKKAAVKSVVRVWFSEKNMTCSYYNDAFDLHEGDIVFVDGKFEGVKGRVTEINYNFKIKLSQYKKVISVADTAVKGEFFSADRYFFTKDKAALDYEKAITWVKAPDCEQEDYIAGTDGTSFSLEHPDEMNITKETAGKGIDYYNDNRVAFIEMDGGRCRAIVEGSKPYTVEFIYKDGKISSLICECFCCGHCKHEVAVMVALRQLIKIIKERYGDTDIEKGYISAVNKKAFINTLLINDNKCSIGIK